MKSLAVYFLLVFVFMSSCVDFDDIPVSGSVVFIKGVQEFPPNTEYRIATAEVYIQLRNSPSIDPWLRSGIVADRFVVTDLLEGTYVIAAGSAVKTFQIIPGRQVEVIF